MKPTASDSCLTAVVAARARYTTLHPDVPLENLVIYGTTMTHSLGSKAALILGLKFRALQVTKEDAYGLRGETLKEALEEDKQAGKAPFIFSSWSWKLDGSHGHLKYAFLGSCHYRNYLVRWYR